MTDAVVPTSQVRGAPTSPSQTHQWNVPYYVKGLALGVPIYFVAIHLWAWLLIVPHFYRRADFRQFYTGAYMMRTGHRHELYDFEKQKAFEDQVVSVEPADLELPFVSPAYQALLLAPLSWLPYRMAFIAFLGLNILFLAACAALSWQETSNLREIYPWLPFAILLGFYPVSWALIHGQDSILLAAVFFVVHILLGRAQNFAAGVLTAFALFKFQIVLPIAVLFLVCKRWRFMVGFTMGAVVLGSLSIWLTGITQAELYVKSLLSIASLNNSSAGMAQHAVLWQMMPNVNGFVHGSLGGLISKTSMTAASVLVSALVFALTARVGPRAKHSADLLLLAIPCAVLMGYHTYMHDLSPLLLPMVVILNCHLPSESGGLARDRWIARAAALMFVAPIIDSYFPNHTYLVALAVAALLYAVASAAEAHGSLVFATPAAQTLQVGTGTL